VVPELVPLAQSAPPQASPEYEEVPEFPPRLSHRHVRSTGRVRGKGFFLTYSQSALARDTIIGWFSRQTRVKRFIVGQEHHQDGNLHWHVTIEYEVEKDVRAQSYFNIEGEHPNIVAWQSRNPARQTYDQWFLNHWEYCKKEDPTPYIVGEEPKENRKKKEMKSSPKQSSLRGCEMFKQEWNSWKRMPRLICLRSMNRSTGHWSGCGKCDRICRRQHAVRQTFRMRQLL